MRRIPLYHTFGNHMHWVDMEWLWGYEVLPGSVRDMLRFCEATGAKGNVNFEGVGYEKLAAENPEALAELKEAVQAGTIEPVGCSYGQPYGQFHGGESNVRQRIYGVRSVLRLLGKRPETFWEEEFDFFPQLPQMLKGAGFKYASLFFQWTWHTPHIPFEESPVVWWEGIDGTRLLTATRNRLNLHQWPEDMDILLRELASWGSMQLTSGGSAPTPVIQQWLELMPSPDWMCRSEIILPKMQELLADERFEIKPATLGEYLREQEGRDVPIRSYPQDEVFHGMSLGKNGDRMRETSSKLEASLLRTETLASVVSSFGRPYPRWDVYPVWELEEAWRSLLAAQHHDNDECEGLCGDIGRADYSRALELSKVVWQRTEAALAKRVAAPTDHQVFFNSNSWEVSVKSGGEQFVVPPFGYAAVPANRQPDHDSPRSITVEASQLADRWSIGEEIAAFEEETSSISLSKQGSIDQLRIGEFHLPGPINWTFGSSSVPSKTDFRTNDGTVACVAESEFGTVEVGVKATKSEALIHINAKKLDVPGGMASGLRLRFPRMDRILADQPYSISEVNPQGSFQKKYPTGDWMTSPQWFETVDNPFHSLSFVDLWDESKQQGWLIVHEGHQQWFATDDSVEVLLDMNDPWDEEWTEPLGATQLRLVPHGPVASSELYRLSRKSWRPTRLLGCPNPEGDLPPSFCFLLCEPSNVIVTALYRESIYSGKGLDRYAAKQPGFENEYPHVIRLVEFDGLETEVLIDLAGTVKKAFKTNLLGEVEEELAPTMKSGRSLLTLHVRPREILTLYVDVEEARKVPRDLDAARHVWATVHRTDEEHG